MNGHADTTPMSRYEYVHPTSSATIKELSLFDTTEQLFYENDANGCWFNYFDRRFQLMAFSEEPGNRSRSEIEFRVIFPEKVGTCNAETTERILRYFLDDTSKENVKCINNWSGYDNYDEVNETTRHFERMWFTDNSFNKKPEGCTRAERTIHINYDCVDEEDHGCIEAIMYDCYIFEGKRTEHDAPACLGFFLKKILEYYNDGLGAED